MTRAELHQCAARIADVDLELRRAMNSTAPDLKAVLRLQAKLAAETVLIARHLAEAAPP